MIDSLKFHHIGIAVRDLDATATLYEAGGYRRSAVVDDPVQHVRICWLSKDGAPLVELLAPLDDDAPVRNILDKVGVSPYHCCYEADNLEEAVAALKRQRYALVRRPVEAPALRGSRVCFLFNKNIGLIELAEAPATIVE